MSAITRSSCADGFFYNTNMITQYQSITHTRHTAGTLVAVYTRYNLLGTVLLQQQQTAVPEFSSPQAVGQINAEY